MAEQDLFGDVPTPGPASTSRPRAAKPSTSAPKHTWFFALRPDAGDASRIDAFAVPLLRAQGLAPHRRIGPDRLHVTLELVGHDVDASVVNLARQAADRVRWSPFEVWFDAARTFAAPSGPFVLMCREGSECLQGAHAFRTALCCAMADHGFQPKRPISRT